MPLAIVEAERPTQPDRSSAPDKEPGAFRTIGEVAEELGVPPHVLRFWESRFAQIRPLKRGGNRRYYRPEDVDLLRGVKRLLHAQGYTIRGAQRVLKQSGVRFVQAVGRGEAEADAPAPAERESEQEVGLGPARRVLALADRVALEAALCDLRACRTLLAELRPDQADLT